MAVRIDTGGLADLQTFGQLPNTVKFTPAHPKTIGLRVGFPMVGKMFSAFGVFKFRFQQFEGLAEEAEKFKLIVLGWAIVRLALSDLKAFLILCYNFVC